MTPPRFSKRRYEGASAVPSVAPVLLRFSRYYRAGFSFEAWGRSGCVVYANRV